MVLYLYSNPLSSILSAVKSQIASVFDSELTPSARMLAEMREHDEGFFHYAQRMSKHHTQYYESHSLSEEKNAFFEKMASDSLIKQKQIEADDKISFDEYLEHYFNHA